MYIMWKESYRLGVDSIDRQHMELFKCTHSLLELIASGHDTQIFRKHIAFLKNYVIVHFRDEEAYQRAVGYADMENHIRAHRAFTQVVANYEEKLEESEYAMPIVKDLAGTLTAWLIHHVTNTDLQIVRKAEHSVQTNHTSYLELFLSGVSETLQSMAGINPSGIQQYETLEQLPGGDVYVGIIVSGGLSGSLHFSYTKDFALNLLESMTFIKSDAIDELAISALAEITNISVGKTATQLAARGVVCEITPPTVSMEPNAAAAYGGIILDTGIGALRVSAQLN